MALTRIFISSTSKDLQSLRNGLRKLLEELGHQPIAFERHDCFANPSKDTFDACLGEVLEADILILALDQRYGSRYPGTSKSITRMEYELARTEGIPTFVLVSSKAMIARELYYLNERNRSIRYGVDDPDLFDFIDSIQKTDYGNWVFEYSSSEEALTWIKGQLSSLLHDLLARRHEHGFPSSSTGRFVDMPQRQSRRRKRAVGSEETSSVLLRVFERLNYSYKPVLFLLLWEQLKQRHRISLGEAAALFRQYYINRYETGNVPEVPPAEMSQPKALSDRDVIRVVWDGPVKAMRGTLLETEGIGARSTLRLSSTLLSASPQIQQQVVQAAQQALESYFSRLTSQIQDTRASS